jgi:hypothetical protein
MDIDLIKKRMFSFVLVSVRSEVSAHLASGFEDPADVLA